MLFCQRCSVINIYKKGHCLSFESAEHGMCICCWLFFTLHCGECSNHDPAAEILIQLSSRGCFFLCSILQQVALPSSLSSTLSSLDSFFAYSFVWLFWNNYATQSVACIHWFIWAFFICAFISILRLFPYHTLTTVSCCQIERRKRAMQPRYTPSTMKSSTAHALP